MTGLARGRRDLPTVTVATGPWLDIDTGAIVRNARALARRAAPASLCAVVKSNAYGHGIGPIGKALSAAAIPGRAFGVFSVAEGLALRESGVLDRTIVLGPVADDELADAASARLECAVLDEDDFERFAPHGLIVHIKVDTGLNRFGVSPEQVPELLERCRGAGLIVAGVYSHLASAKELDLGTCRKQCDALLRAVPEFAPRVPLHLAASAAAIMWPELRLDMVRCGIALYGGWPSDDVRALMAGEAPDFKLI